MAGRATQRGFTLMELITVMTIIGVLTAIAIPNYTEYIRRTNRKEARAQLLQAVVWMEKFRNERGRYDEPTNANNPPLTFPVTLLQSPVPPAAAKYTIAVAATPATYTITATAVGAMAGDVCTTLAVNETHQRLFTPVTANADTCWNR